MHGKYQYHEDRFQGKSDDSVPYKGHAEYKKGTEMLLVPDNEKSTVRMLPLSKEKTAIIKLLIKDEPGSLATVANILAEKHINIIMSESKTLIKGKFAEWKLIVDTSECDGDLKKIEDTEFVENVNIL